MIIIYIFSACNFSPANAFYSHIYIFSSEIMEETVHIAAPGRCGRSRSKLTGRRQLVCLIMKITKVMYL